MRIVNCKFRNINCTFCVSNFSCQTLKPRLALSAFLIFIFAFALNAFAQIATGGSYTLEKSVIANGGASGPSASAGGNFTADGTIGQFAVGIQQQNSPFMFQPGFWTPAPLVPTAATVNLGGRVTTQDGRGIRNVRITLTMPGGETRSALSGAFGYYRFTDVPVGETYILMARAKSYALINPIQILTLLEEREDIDFVADESLMP